VDTISFLGFSEPISSIVHLLSALFFLVAGTTMIYKSNLHRLPLAGMVIYIFCAVFLFSMSGVYHLLEKETTANYVLRILDHAGIYLMIAGSFTPFQLILLKGAKRWGVLIPIWILAITGLTLTAIFFDSMPEWLLLSFFIAMGWLSLFTVYFIRKIDFLSVKYIFSGGVLYTVGAAFDFLRWPNLIDGVLAAHELFHLFITAAAMVHFKRIWDLSLSRATHSE
jgi:channel protein (hemolysin III family)